MKDDKILNFGGFIKYVQFGELSLPLPFVPILLLLTGLTLLGGGVVGHNDKANESSKRVLSSIGMPFISVRHHMRYFYYRNAFTPHSVDLFVRNGLLVLLVLVINLEIYVGQDVFTQSVYGTYFNGMMNFSALDEAMRLALMALALGSLIYLGVSDSSVSAKSMLLAFTTLLFVLILVSTSNMVVFYVALEGVSLLLFVLATLPQSQYSVEAGLKYFIQSSLASIFLLMGLALLFAQTQLFDMSEIMLEDFSGDDSLALFSTTLIVVAMLFKIAAFPAHFGVPDVYRGPGFPMLMIFAVSAKASSAFARLNVVSGLGRSSGLVTFSGFLIIASAGSLLLGMLGAIEVISSKGSVRRFIAYTGINQIGFIRMGLTTFTVEGFVASFGYLLIYLAASLLFIGILSRMYYGVDFKEVESFKELRNGYSGRFASSRRFDMFILAMSVGSMAGLPPLAGFYAKISVGMSLIHKLENTGSGFFYGANNVSLNALSGATSVAHALAFISLLVLSVVVSLMSALYYFKFYEYLVAPVTEAEVVSSDIGVDKTLHMTHSMTSLTITFVRLAFLCALGPFVCGDQQSFVLSLPSWLVDVVSGPEPYFDTSDGGDPGEDLGQDIALDVEEFLKEEAKEEPKN